MRERALSVEARPTSKSAALSVSSTRAAIWSSCPCFARRSKLNSQDTKISIQTSPHLLCMGLFSKFLLCRGLAPSWSPIVVNAGLGPAIHGFCRGAKTQMPGTSPGMTAADVTVKAYLAPQLSTFSAAMNASCGMSTLPNCRIFFLPSFCFSRSLRLRVMSPP